MAHDIRNDFEAFLATLARSFAQSGNTKCVAVLAASTASIRESSYDNWDGGIYGFEITLELPSWLYSSLGEDRQAIEGALKSVAVDLMKVFPSQHVDAIQLTTQIVGDSDWRDKAKSWLRGEGVNNQGRVRSDNIASRQWDGLLFRSQPEIYLYRSLKARGVTLMPLPVVLRGGETYARIEPDFLIYKSGVLMVIEVDGSTVHTETPVEAHNRLTLLQREGAHLERVSSADCDTLPKAENVAMKLLGVLDKVKNSR